MDVEVTVLGGREKGMKRKDQALSNDVRHIFRQNDWTHREFISEQIEINSKIGRRYRREADETEAGSSEDRC